MAAQVAADQSLAGVLFDALIRSEPVVRMRAADALEKASRAAPALLAGRESVLLALLSSPQPKEIRWHLLQLASRIKWSTEDQPAVLRAILQCFEDRSSIVKTSALQALFDLAQLGEPFERALRIRMRAALRSGTPAMRARARKLMALRHEA